MKLPVKPPEPPAAEISEPVREELPAQTAATRRYEFWAVMSKDQALNLRQYLIENGIEYGGINNGNGK